MKKRIAGVLAASVVAVTAFSGAAAMASSGDQEGGATGPGVAEAKAAAVRETGGTVNAVERDTENGATWEVEVTRPDGSVADVRLDANAKVIVVETDTETESAR